MDINLYTSRGDGNGLKIEQIILIYCGYKPIYLERGRKQMMKSHHSSHAHSI